MTNQTRFLSSSSSGDDQYDKLFEIEEPEPYKDDHENGYSNSNNTFNMNPSQHSSIITYSISNQVNYPIYSSLPSNDTHADLFIRTYPNISTISDREPSGRSYQDNFTRQFRLPLQERSTTTREVQYDQPKVLNRVNDITSESTLSKNNIPRKIENNATSDNQMVNTKFQSTVESHSIRSQGFLITDEKNKFNLPKANENTFNVKNEFPSIKQTIECNDCNRNPIIQLDVKVDNKPHVYNPLEIEHQNSSFLPEEPEDFDLVIEELFPDTEKPLSQKIIPEIIINENVTLNEDHSISFAIDAQTEYNNQTNSSSSNHLPLYTNRYSKLCKSEVIFLGTSSSFNPNPNSHHLNDINKTITESTIIDDASHSDIQNVTLDNIIDKESEMVKCFHVSNEEPGYISSIYGYTTHNSSTIQFHCITSEGQTITLNLDDLSDNSKQCYNKALDLIIWREIVITESRKEISNQFQKNEIFIKNIIAYDQLCIDLQIPRRIETWKLLGNIKFNNLLVHMDEWKKLDTFIVTTHLISIQDNILGVGYYRDGTLGIKHFTEILPFPYQLTLKEMNIIKTA
jgi:hypothetical protein